MTLETLLTEVAALGASLPGRLGVLITYLPNGPTVAHHADDLFPSASVIKILVLAEVCRQVEQGRIGWDDDLVLTEQTRVEGSGVLRYLGDGLRLSVRDAAYLMMIVSDNTATNMLIDVVSVAAVNDLIQQARLPRTVLNRKISFDSAGYFAETTPADMARAMSLLAMGALVSAEASRTILAMMEKCDAESMIPRYLPINPYVAELGQPAASAVVAHKTGSISGTRNDVGLVTLTENGCQCRYIVSAFTAGVVDGGIWTPENIATRAVAEVSRLAYEAARAGLGTWEAVGAA